MALNGDRNKLSLMIELLNKNNNGFNNIFRDIVYSSKQWLHNYIFINARQYRSSKPNKNHEWINESLLKTMYAAYMTNIDLITFECT